MVSALSWGLHDGGRVPVRTITGGVVGLVAGFQSGQWGVVGFSALISFCGWNWGSSGKGLGAVQPCNMHSSGKGLGAVQPCNMHSSGKGLGAVQPCNMHSSGKGLGAVQPCNMHSSGKGLGAVQPCNMHSSGKGLGAVQPCNMHFSYRCVCLSGWGWGGRWGGSNHLTNANAGSRLRRRSSRRGLRLTEPASGISGAVKWPQAQPSVPVASSGVALILIHHCVTELSVSGWGWGDSVPARSVC